MVLQLIVFLVFLVYVLADLCLIKQTHLFSGSIMTSDIILLSGLEAAHQLLIRGAIMSKRQTNHKLHPQHSGMIAARRFNLIGD